MAVNLEPILRVDLNQPIRWQHTIYVADFTSNFTADLKWKEGELDQISIQSMGSEYV